MESGSKTSVRKWKVLLDHGDSDDVLFAFAPKRQHSFSGLLMLATVNLHCHTTYVTRCNHNFRLHSTTLDEMTELPYLLKAYSSTIYCSLYKHNHSRSVIFVLKA